MKQLYDKTFFILLGIFFGIFVFIPFLIFFVFYGPNKPANFALILYFMSGAVALTTGTGDWKSGDPRLPLIASFLFYSLLSAALAVGTRLLGEWIRSAGTRGNTRRTANEQNDERR